MNDAQLYARVGVSETKEVAVGAEIRTWEQRFPLSVLHWPLVHPFIHRCFHLSCLASEWPERPRDRDCLQTQLKEAFRCTLLKKKIKKERKKREGGGEKAARGPNPDVNRPGSRPGYFLWLSFTFLVYIIIMLPVTFDRELCTSFYQWGKPRSRGMEWLDGGSVVKWQRHDFTSESHSLSAVLTILRVLGVDLEVTRAILFPSPYPTRCHLPLPIPSAQEGHGCWCFVCLCHEKRTESGTWLWFWVTGDTHCLWQEKGLWDLGWVLLTLEGNHSVPSPAHLWEQ